MSKQAQRSRRKPMNRATVRHTITTREFAAELARARALYR